MQLDDTPVKCQAGQGQPSYQAHLWTLASPDVGGVVYRFTQGRAGELIAKEIGEFSGYLAGDDHSGNKDGAKAAPGEIQVAGCWEHTIRKFRDARSESAKVAKLFESTCGSSTASRRRPMRRASGEGFLRKCPRR